MYNLYYSNFEAKILIKKCLNKNENNNNLINLYLKDSNLPTHQSHIQVKVQLLTPTEKFMKAIMLMAIDTAKENTLILMVMFTLVSL